MNILWDRPGGVLEVDLPERADEAVALWRQQARRLLDAVGWCDEAPAARLFPGGASLAVSAPLDGLYAATLVNEWACEAATAMLRGDEPPHLATAAEGIRREIEDERNPALVALERAAAAHGVAFLRGDDRVTVGLGPGGRSWRERDLPAPDAIDWAAIHDVPVAYVTGTNGKSTTVRLTAAIAAAAGLVPGLCTSDWIRIGDEIVAEGDYSGPEGSRRVLRDPRIGIAILEVARGGILRRGLPLARVDAACVTNVAADHLGEFGVLDLDTLAAAKLVVARAVKPGGRVVLNRDDARLAARGARLDHEVLWFALAPGRDATCFIDQGWFVVEERGSRRPLLAVADFPLGLGGAARHNLANGLAAIGLALALGLPDAAIAAGLSGFGGGPRDNPGRANLFEVGGVRLLVDFAHNPHGVAAILAMAEALPARRRLVLLGQAGDRGDADIRDLARTVAASRPDRVIVKEMDAYRRGRPPGEVPQLLTRALREAGIEPTAIGQAGSEIEAARQALDWAEPGDLLLLLSHADRGAVLALIETLQRSGWRPGRPVP
jgi:UDP-N-acetylmuramyl tripeptide synthase